jgi:hypothetical protein
MNPLFRRESRSVWFWILLISCFFFDASDHFWIFVTFTGHILPFFALYLVQRLRHHPFPHLIPLTVKLQNCFTKSPFFFLSPEFGAESHTNLSRFLLNIRLFSLSDFIHFILYLLGGELFQLLL